MPAAIHGAAAPKAVEVADVLFASGVRQRDDAGEGADVGHDVDAEEDQHRLRARRAVLLGLIATAARPTRMIARLADAAVGHHALDVGLQQRDDVAERHRQRRDNRAAAPRDRRLLTGKRPPKTKTRKRRESSRLRADREEERRGRGRAFVDVRRPHVERHRRDLEAEAGEDEDIRRQEIRLPLAERRDRSCAISLRSVVPVAP